MLLLLFICCQGIPFTIEYLIDKGTDPNITLYFDGNVIAAPYNSTTLSGSTGVMAALPLGLHLVTVHAFNMFGAVTINVNFTIDDPIINPLSTASAVETVSQQIVLTD